MDLAAVARIAASEELRKAVGDDYAALFQRRIADLEQAAAAELQDAEQLYELVRHAISLQNLVDSDGDEEGMVFAAMNYDEEACGAAVAVAEAISSSLAAFAAFLAGKDTSEEHFSQLMHRLSIDLDVFSANLFGGLQRLEDAYFFEASAQAVRSRLLAALQSTCLWAVVVVGRVVGFACFTSAVLWEWVWQDAMSACILVKGALAALDEEQLGCPQDVGGVRRMLLQALLGLASPDVAFAGQAAVNVEEPAIAKRNEDLILHRRTLAWAVLNSHVLQVVLTASAEAPTTGASLASFLSSLLQPDLAAEADTTPAGLRAAALVALGGHTESGVHSIVEAKNAAAMLCSELQRCGVELWRQFCATLTAFGLEAPAGFLLSLVQLSYFVPLEPQVFDDLLSAVLNFVDPGGDEADAAMLTALCFIAANCGRGPGEAERLAAALGTSMEVKAHLDQRWERWMWQGCVRMDVLSQWTVSIEISQALQHFPDVVDMNPPQCDPEPQDQTEECQQPRPPAPGAGARLQDLMHDAPPPFRCGLGGQLMMDPVQTPEGFIVERAALVAALACSGGHCPLSGAALSIDDCPRQPALRRRITKWIRERKAIAAQRRLEARE